MALSSLFVLMCRKETTHSLVEQGPRPLILMLLSSCVCFNVVLLIFKVCKTWVELAKVSYVFHLQLPAVHFISYNDMQLAWE